MKAVAFHNHIYLSTTQNEDYYNMYLKSGMLRQY